MKKKLAQNSIINTRPPAQVQQPAPLLKAPELFWIGTPSSSTCLWPAPRASAEKPLEEFLEAMLEAKLRIWIMDPHFDGVCGFAAIQMVLDMSLELAEQQQRMLDVRILTSVLGELEHWLKERKQSYPTVQRKGGCAGVHDRYALIDHELWHFGSTVGGGHPDLSTATRGWPGNHANDFATLFLAWWDRSS